MKIDKKLKRKWVAALRDPEWRQITRQYHDDSQGVCAIGVLRDLAPDRGVGWLAWKDGKVSAADQRAIIKMNDDKGYSLNQIADWIEENL
jgi:hypothetical protein